MYGNQYFKTSAGEKNEGKNKNYDYSVFGFGSSASLVAEERGYVLGVEDERRKFQKKINNIISNLKARGYPLMHIAEDTGFSEDEIAAI